MRKQLALAIETDPYRFVGHVESDLGRVRALLERGAIQEAAELYAGPLLPHSDAPGIERERQALEGWIRHAVMTCDDREAVWAWVQTPSGREDAAAWRQVLLAMDFRDPRRSQAAAQVGRLRALQAWATMSVSPVLSAEQLAKLASVGEERTAAVGDVLYRIGDERYPFVAILEGEAAVLDSAGDEIVRHGASGFLGELNLMTGQTVYLTAVVTQPMRYIAVEREVLRPMLFDDGPLGDVLLSAFIARREGCSAIRASASRSSGRGRRPPPARWSTISAAPGCRTRGATPSTPRIPRRSRCSPRCRRRSCRSCGCRAARSCAGPAAARSGARWASAPRWRRIRRSTS